MVECKHSNPENKDDYTARGSDFALLLAICMLAGLLAALVSRL